VVVAVCVNETLPVSDDSRFRLMRELAALRHEVAPEPFPAVWIYPGGYFGFDALRFAQLLRAKEDPGLAWPQLPQGTLDSLQRTLAEQILPLHGPRATLVVGMDDGAAQCAWIGQNDSDGQIKSQAVIVRGASTIAARCFSVGKLAAAAFVCGEFTGSPTPSNGPFYDDKGERCYLSQPAQQLGEVKLVIDLAHSQVPGTVFAAVAHQRYPHQRQMERLASAGIASVLTHHHAEETVQGRASHRHQSSWLLYSDGTWVNDASVRELRTGSLGAGSGQ
jgi:hypothetical protein